MLILLSQKATTKSTDNILVMVEYILVPNQDAQKRPPEGGLIEFVKVGREITSLHLTGY